MFKVSIPEVPKEEILRRYSQIKPLGAEWIYERLDDGTISAHTDDKLYWLREFSWEELWGQSYIWDDNTERAVEDGELIPVPELDFRCLHSCSQGIPFFRPSVWEVLAQLDMDKCWCHDIVAFSMIKKPLTCDDFYEDDLTTNAYRSSYHVSTIRLYRRA